MGALKRLPFGNVNMIENYSVSKCFDFGVCVIALAVLCGCAQGPFGTAWQSSNSMTGNG